MRPEPKNPADEFAVAVFSIRNVQLGYLTAERAPWIGSMIRSGRQITIVFQGKTQWGAWARIAFDGELPILPDQREPLEAEPVFYPDEVWPDE